MRFISFGFTRWARLGLVIGLLVAPAAPGFGQGNSLADMQRLSAEARKAYRSGDLIGAMTIAERVASVTARRYGDDHIRHAQALNNLALFQDLNGSLSEAAANYRQAIGIVHKSGESHHRLLGDLKNNLAAVVLQQCRMGKARSLYADALKLTEANFGSYHPETQFVRANVDWLDRFAAGKATPAQVAQFGRLFKSCMS